jgi:hypothetical protein
MFRAQSLIQALFIVTFIGGCSGSKQDSLVGTWKEDGGSTFSLHSDGSLSGNIKTGSWGILTPTDIPITGTWRVAGDDVIWHITQSTFAQDKLV